ncbi:hypothetical protein ACLUVW_06170 [Bifidobacterium pseudolongum subsp. globosum]|uniref:hypothetical protein n=1 Tax=Bifidobacterium pseudolongum TaxID=1694 RepID=UPI0039926529
MTRDVFPDYGLVEEERRATGFYDAPVTAEQAKRDRDSLVALLREIQPGVAALERRRAEVPA